MSIHFELSSQEEINLENWNTEHLKEKHKGKEPYSGAIGGRLTFLFTSTGIGVFCKVRCSCGVEEDLTDYA